MKVSEMRDILERLPDNDEIVVMWWDYEEMGDWAEEQGIVLDRDAWHRVVKDVNTRYASQHLREFIDQRVRIRGYAAEHDDYCECEDCCPDD